MNRGKRSVALDLSSPGDLEIARDLASRADVVVDNFRPGLMASYGLAYTDLAERNPRVVTCSISGFGSGAGAGIPGYDFVVQAVGGLMSITGEPTRPHEGRGRPRRRPHRQGRASSGSSRPSESGETSGRGQHVEVDLLSSLLGSLVNQAAATPATGTPPGRLGNRHPSIAPYETLECADGPLAVAVGNDEQFGRFAVALGLPSLAVDARFATNALRVANRDALASAAEEILRTEPAALWQERLQSARIAAGAVGTIADAFALADTLGLDPTWSPGDGELRQVRNPVRLSRTPARQPGPPPRLGDTSAADLLDPASPASTASTRKA